MRHHTKVHACILKVCILPGTTVEHCCITGDKVSDSLIIGDAKHIRINITFIDQCGPLGNHIIQRSVHIRLAISKLNIKICSVRVCVIVMIERILQIAKDGMKC